jgi:hypothetical protein
MSEVEFILYGLFGCCSFIQECSDCCFPIKEIKENKENKDYDYKMMRVIES